MKFSIVIAVYKVEKYLRECVDSILSQHHKIQKLYMVLPFVSVFGPLINSGESMIRISMYFHMYMMVLIPYGIDLYIPAKQRKTAYVLLTGA